MSKLSSVGWIVGGVAAIYVVYKISQGTGAIANATGAVVNAVNPTNPNNLPTTAINTVTHAVTGSTLPWYTQISDWWQNLTGTAYVSPVFNAQGQQVPNLNTTTPIGG